jgi:hypothetical protein
MPTAIHRCKTCNRVTRVDYRRQMNSIGYGRKEAVYFRESDGVKHVQPVECCGRVTGWNWLKAFLNPAVKCDARCTHAKGFNCECSCGGENHGRGGVFTQLLTD